MSIDLSKIGYGAVVGRATADGVVVSKLGYGSLVDVTPSPGIVVSKVGYGAIIIPDLTVIPVSGVTDDSALYGIESIIPVTSPVFVDDNPQIEAPSIIAAFVIPDRERNPFPAHIPYQPDVRELGDFQASQQRIIREQHNKTQAGDTTFDYGLLLKSYPSQEFTLGSLGRFYHENYGLMLARYVKFTGMVDTQFQGAPVGRVKNTLSGVDWVVTNDYSKSDSDLVAGMIFIAETPAEDTFGWMVTHGANVARVRAETETIPAQNTPYSWTGSGIIGVGTRGRVLARRWGKTFDFKILAGRIFIALEGLSPADLIFEIQETIADLSSGATDADGRITANTAAISAAQTNITTLQTQYSQLLTRIQTEEQARVRDIASIRALLGSAIDWSSEILTQCNLVRTEFAAADATIQAIAVDAQTKANNALATLTSLDVAGLSLTVDSVQSSLLTLIGRLTSFSTDMITVPPTDQQGLIYDLATEKWVPNDVVLTVVAGTGIDVDSTDPKNPVIALEDTAVTPGTYGDATHVAQIVVDQQGRLTGVSEVIISGGGGGGASTPSVRASNIQTSSNNSYTVSWPTGTVEGDVVIIFVGHAYQINTPSGWNSFQVTNQGFYNGAIFAKVMTAADITAGSVTVTTTGTYNGIISAVTIDGSTVTNYVTSSAVFGTSGVTSANTNVSLIQSTDLIIAFATTRGNIACDITNTSATSLQNQQATEASAAVETITGDSTVFGESVTATFASSGSGYYLGAIVFR